MSKKSKQREDLEVTHIVVKTTEVFRRGSPLINGTDLILVEKVVEEQEYYE